MHPMNSKRTNLPPHSTIIPRLVVSGAVSTIHLPVDLALVQPNRSVWSKIHLATRDPQIQQSHQTWVELHHRCTMMASRRRKANIVSFLLSMQPNKDDFGSDPFAMLHAPTAASHAVSPSSSLGPKSGPPPRPESPSPALPPKKAKQPPPRPAPPRPSQVYCVLCELIWIYEDETVLMPFFVLFTGTSIQ